MRFLAFLPLFISHCFGAEVVDLGRLEITGSARGPQIYVVQGDQASVALSAKFLKWKLVSLEQQLLKSGAKSDPNKGNTQ